MIPAEHLKILRQADSTGRLTADMKAAYPGVHFCPDWDYMAVGPGMPEHAACTCPKPALLHLPAGVA